MSKSILIIDGIGNNFSNYLKQRFTILKYLENDFSENTISKYASYIADKVGEEKNILIILNAELCLTPNEQPLNYKGIELLKWLRIRHQLLNPILLLGFSDLRYILKQYPEHIILSAPGCKYLQLPLTKEVLYRNIDNLNCIESISEEYIPFLRADFNILGFGHSFANKFGIYALEYLHEVFDKNYQKSEFDENDIYEFKKALLIYGYKLSENKIIRHIEIDSPKNILLIDDQEKGWSKLCKAIFSKFDVNINSFNPNTDLDYIEACINEAREIKPDVILLDLKLNGNKEKGMSLEDISGYKVLLELKDKFPSIPIIIFSATNKAENLSKLLKAKAFGLWVKPRIEADFIIDESYSNLIKIVNDALNIYKFKIQKTHVESDYVIESLNENSGSSSMKNYIKQFDLIITDTNCWMQSKNLEKVPNLYKNLYLTALTSKNSFYILDDIQLELLDHKYKTKSSSANSDELVINSIAASYGLDLLHKIVKEKYIKVQTEHLQPKSKHHYNQFNFEYYEENNRFFERCFRKKREIYSRNYYDFNGYTEEKIEKLKEKIAKSNHRSHADKAFIEIIFNKINNPDNLYRKKKILFISEDVECRDNLYYLLNSCTPLKRKNPQSKRKIGIYRVLSGIFSGKNLHNQEPFEIEITDPFSFSEKIEKLCEN